MVQAQAVSLEVRSPASWAIVTGWQKVLLGLALCLPIPTLALSGIALPMPMAVHRAAIAIVEGTQQLAGVFAGGFDADTEVVPQQRPGQGSVDRTGSSIATLRTLGSDVPSDRTRRRDPAVRARGRTFVAAPTKRVTAAPRPGEAANSSPAPRPDSAAVAEPVAMSGTPAQSSPGAATEIRPERATTEPASRPADPLPRPTPVVEPPPSPPPPAPPPPAPEPSLLEPVTKPLQPVTKPLEPAIRPLEPVTQPLEPVIDAVGSLLP